MGKGVSEQVYQSRLIEEILIEREKVEVKIESALECVKIKRDSRRFCLL